MKNVEKKAGGAEGWDIKRALEELHLHQEELEAQNRDLREMSAQLEESRDRYADLYDFSPVGYLGFDAAGLIREANLTAARMMRAERAALLGRPFGALLAPGEGTRFREHLRHCLEAHAQVTGEFWLAPPGADQPFLIQAMSVQVADRGGEARVRTAILDITESWQARKSLEDMERKVMETQKLESLGVLAGGIAHDFNNILSGILGYANLASLELPPGGEASQSLRKIEEATLKASALCRQLLAYSGRARFSVECISLANLVAETAHLIELSVSKRVRLQFLLADGLPPVQVDATQIRQVIMNLVINASEAIGDRDGVVAVQTGLFPPGELAALAQSQPALELRAGETYVCLEVRDTGCGIPPEALGRIFDPFFTTKFTGRGLGLAAVQGIVHGHRGALLVDSSLGEGTSFRLVLPAAAGKAPVKAAADDDESWKGSGSVLVVDDDEAVRPLFAAMMTALGFQAITAADGRAGVEAFRAHPGLRAVLLDLTMPVMNGAQAFQAMRRIDPRVPVVLMSGYDERDSAKNFEGGAPDAFIEKPFTLAALRRKFREVLAAKEAGKR